MLRRILTFFGYFGLTSLVIAVTVGLVAYGNDYVYDFASHTIIQKGHVIISSLPNSLQLVADGKLLNKKTPYQAAYKVGSHTFELNRTGFWPWKKALEVVAGQVSLVKYAVLVPRVPQTAVLDTKPGISAQSMSKDHRHWAYVTTGADAALYTLDLGNPKAVKLYTPKPAVGTDPAEVLVSVTWSDDASHLLIVSTMGAQTVYRLAAAGGGEPVNLTAQYGYDFAGLKFSASNWKQLYWTAPEGLRRLDVDAQTVSAVLADKVSQFWITPDHVLYVQQTDVGRSLWSMDNRGRHQELIQALAESDTYSVSSTSYLGADELAIVPAKTGVGTLYTGIFGDTPVAKTLARGVVSAAFSPNGRMLVFSSPTSMVTYDLERSSIEGQSVLYSIVNQPGELTALTWFDDFHLLSTRGGRVYWSEFDGTNRVDLGTSVDSFPAYATADDKSIVLLRPSGTTMRLVQLLIKP